MNRPIAWRHLARLHELTTTASACRVMVDRGLVDLSIVVDAARNDAALAEEVLSIARDRGWKLPEPAPYEWGRIDDAADPLPRLGRILERDAFELDEAARRTDDEEVRSLVIQLRAERQALLASLERFEPLTTLPGAK